MNHLNIFRAVSIAITLITVSARGDAHARAPARGGATITVNTATDNFDQTDGLCELREALFAANFNQAFGGCASGTLGEDTIVIGISSPIVLRRANAAGNEDNGLTGDMDVREDVIIRPSGVTRVQLDANNRDRFFDVHRGRLTLSSFVIFGGFSNPAPSGSRGGAIRVRNGARLSADKTLFTQNYAELGGALAIEGEASLDDVELRQNRATGGDAVGGAIYNQGTLSLTVSTMMSNTAYSGGAIYNVNNLDLQDSVLRYNDAVIGGALYNLGNAVMFRATLADNDVGDKGGAIFNVGSLSVSGSGFTSNTAFAPSSTATAGGALYNSDIGEATISNSGFVGNSAFSGGAISNDGVLTITQASEFQSNIASLGGALHIRGEARVQNTTIVNHDLTSITGSSGGGIYVTGSLMLSSSKLFSNTTNANGHAITIHNGSARIQDGRIEDNGRLDLGRGTIYVDGGSVDIVDTFISENAAQTGGGLLTIGPARASITRTLVYENASNTSGGGLYLAGTASFIADSDIAYNGARVSGGGIYALGDVTLTTTSVQTNTTLGSDDRGSGAGMHVELGVVRVIDSVFADNEARGANTLGGGIAVSSTFGSLSITDSAIVNNRATSGGGLFAYYRASLSNVTVSGNSGAGIDTLGTVALTHVTLANNRPVNLRARQPDLTLPQASAVLRNTVLADAPSCDVQRMTSLGGNIASTASCPFTQPSDKNNVNPALAPLGLYGHLRQYTHPPFSGSPVIDAGISAGCPPADQRGAPRPQGAGCDSGAVEAGGAPVPTPTPGAPTATPMPNVTPGAPTLTPVPRGMRLHLPLVRR